MFKILIKTSVNGEEKEVIVETESTDMALAILRHQNVISVDSDIPNRNTNPTWIDFQKQVHDYNLSNTPLTVTC